MDYVRKFLQVEGLIGQGAFGRVLLTSPLQNQQQFQVHNSPNVTLTNVHSSSTSSPVCSMNVDTSSNDEDNREKSQQQILTISPIQDSDQDTSFASVNSSQPSRFALKCVYPLLKPQRLANELRHLRDLGGISNVVKMHTAHFHEGSLYIVMELIIYDRFVDIVASLDYKEILNYMKNLLIALRHVHSHNIMHRDIKPANFLYNRRDKKFLLVDFGLAQTQKLPSNMNFSKLNSTNNQPTTPSMSLKSTPTTPTTPKSTNTRRLTGQLFPGSRHDSHIDTPVKLNISPTKKNIAPTVNITSHIIHKSPSHHFINLTPIASNGTPNISTKRQMPDGSNLNEHFNHDFKKLRVSNNEKPRDDPKEPMKLTVGAYESPVTTNDSSNNRRASSNLQNQKMFTTPTVPTRRLPFGKRCGCRGKPKTCSICMSRPDSNAPKSGTPGYKAPEILLRHHNQTTAIDIWSAGVIFACLLSGHFPFFRDVDDQVSLAEIITILGSTRVFQAAKALGIKLIVEPKRDPVDLADLCRLIRSRGKDKRQLDIPDEAFDLLNLMLEPNPCFRITASQALNHPVFQSLLED